VGTFNAQIVSVNCEAANDGIWIFLRKEPFIG
jgi:hypothetical protein